MHEPLSYQKWDTLDAAGSDVEGIDADGTKLPLLSKSPQQLEADEAVYEKYKGVFKQHCKGQYALATRKLLARFIAIQHRGSEPTNTFRYADIMALVQQRREELLARSSVDLLCELHKRILNASPTEPQPTDAATQDAQVVVEAVNTLEAIQAHQPTSMLFESLCNPTQSEDAKALYTRYANKEFAKTAMMRYLFGDDSFAEIEREMSRDGESRAKGAKGDEWECCGIDREICYLLASTFGTLLILLVIVILVITRFATVQPPIHLANADWQNLAQDPKEL
tara:strand:+ start:1662 stop:2504 length:843 start_codon:yes stop_codon:yes gene_type:complete